MKEMFDKLPPGTIFRKGETTNSPEGLYMTDSNYGAALRWLAKKGWANDWVVYVHWRTSPWDFIETNGDKLRVALALKVMPDCTDIIDLYRD